jgi:hypothetical protein
VGDILAEALPQGLGCGERVLDHVVEQARGDADGIEFHPGQDVGNLQRVDEIRLAGVTDLPFVFESREHIGPPQQLQVSVRVIAPDAVQQILEANHRGRCLTLVVDVF